MKFLIRAQTALNAGALIALVVLLLWSLGSRADGALPGPDADDASGTAGHVLQRVDVVGKAIKPYAVTEQTGGTKTDTPILDTPMAVQIVPGAVIEDRQLRTALEAVKNLSGVQSSTYEFYDQFLIRGFDSGYGTTFRNGLQLRGITEAVNMAFVDRIEVIKGPASMLYGRVEPGGFVNVVTKRPQAVAAFAVEQQLGDWGFRRTTADATGPVTADGHWLYRVTGDLDRAESWVANAHRDNKAIAASLSWQPEGAFRAALELEHYDYKTAWLDASVPFLGSRPAPVPRSFSILFPQSWSEYPYRTVRTLVALEWTYALSGSWKLTGRGHYVGSNENQQGVYADAFDGVSQYTAVRFTHSGPDWSRTTYNANLDLAGEFATGPVRHKLLIGADVSRFTDDTPGSTGDIANGLPLDVFHPVYPDYSSTLTALAATDATNVLWRDRSKDAGLYVQDQLEVASAWRILIGGRYDEATDSYSDTYGTRDSGCYPTCTAQPVTPYPTDRAFSPRAGVLYKASDAVSAYASYSRSFGSANGRDNLGNPLKAQIGTQYEVGIKMVSTSGRLSASATLFDLTKSNIPEYDPVNYFPRIVGEARSRGLELDAVGQLAEHVSILASYTYDQAIITKDPLGGTEGRHLSGVAPHVGNAWLKYDSAPTTGQGWSLGAGAYVSAARWGDDPNTTQMPGFVRLDLMAAYRIPVGRASVSARLNVNNVLDAVYFDHGGYGAAAYGAPRSFMGSIRVDF